MDGVLVDFVAQYKKIIGVTPHQVYVPGQTATPEKEANWNKFVDAQAFVDAPLMPDAIELINYLFHLLNSGRIDKLEICTSAGGKARYNDVKPQKLLWLKHRELDHLTAHITQNGYKKADVIDKNCYDILIDDTLAVVENFAKHGGHIVHHVAAADTLTKLEKILNELSGN
jgi:hypothetical protein